MRFTPTLVILALIASLTVISVAKELDWRTYVMATIAGLGIFVHDPKTKGDNS